MKQLQVAILAFALAPIGASFPISSAQAASTIERACIKSDRKAASPPLCGCIQDVADMMLSTQEQKIAAKFFDEPHAAQEMRQSSRRSDEKFWLTYKEFGETARTFCTS
jgi:hypothetical protein